MKPIAWSIAAATVIALFPGGSEAHKGITSRFTFNADVYPVFLNRCGRCHIDGGVGPMSLLKYEDAFPWAESLRTELLTASDESNDFIKAAHRQLSAKELDIVLDWATGGTPEGDKAATPPPAVLRNEWSDGAPDLVADLPEFAVAANVMEADHESSSRMKLDVPRTADRFDLLPGNPSIVRTAVIALRAADGTLRTLGTWFPRQSPQPIALKPPVRIEPGAQIVARIHYKKTWKFEGQQMTDRTAVGLYFTD